MATGIWKPRIPDIPGHELMDGYEDLSMNASDYEGKSVMILGNYQKWKLFSFSIQE